jgi:5'(3')-deoxyribonucleotidase
MRLNQIKNLLEDSGNKNTKYTIAIDMDGVIADFSAGAYEVLGKSKDQVSTSQFWKEISRHDKHVSPFFENLPVMNDAHELMNFVTSNFERYYILTASGYTPKNVDEQKRRWVAKVFSPVLKVNVVKKSADKAQFANPNTVLIDDRRKAVDPFLAAGGKAILHTDAKSTIEQLKKLLGEGEDNLPS